MNDWEQTFLRKLEEGKRLWQCKFEQFATDCVKPVFEQMQSFTAGQGISAVSPETEDGSRRYKFGLTENGYLLITFRLHGFEEIEIAQEIVVPGAGSPISTTKRSRLADATEAWVEQHFQAGLSRFITRFVEASDPSECEAAELVAV